MTLVTVALLASGAAAAPAHVTAEAAPAVTVVYAEGRRTYLVERQLPDQFTSILHCLPVQLTVRSALQRETASSGTSVTRSRPTDFATVVVNSSDEQAARNIQARVQDQQLVRTLYRKVLWLFTDASAIG